MFKIILKGTEELLKKEAGFTEEEFKTEKSNSDEADVANALVAYKRFVAFYSWYSQTQIAPIRFTAYLESVEHIFQYTDEI